MRIFGYFLWLIGSISLIAGETPVRLAILADPALEKEADLLTVRLSNSPKIELLERSQIRKVLGEQKISIAGINAISSLKVGKLLKAEGLLVLKLETVESQSVLTLRMIAVNPGFITATSYEEFPLKNQEEWETSIEKLVSTSKEKLCISRAEAVPVTFLDLRAQVSNQKNRELESSINILLQRRMMQQKEIFVLERKQMESLEWEKDLNEENKAFWTAGAVINGTIELKGEKAAISVNLENAGLKLPPIQVQGPYSEVTKLVDSLVLKILPLLQNEFRSLPPWDPLIEARKLQLECYSARCAGLYELSREYADAVWALGLRDDKSRRYRIYAYCRETVPWKVSLYNWSPNWKTVDLIKEPKRINAACRMIELLQSQLSNQALKPKDLENNAFFLGAVMLDGCYQQQLHKTEPELVAELRRLVRETYNDPQYLWDEGTKIRIASRYGGYWCEEPEEVLNLYRTIFSQTAEKAPPEAINFLYRHALNLSELQNIYFPKTIFVPLWKSVDPSTLNPKIELLANSFCSSESIETQFIGWKIKMRFANSPEAKIIADKNIDLFLWDQREKVIERLNLEENTRYNHGLNTFFDSDFMGRAFEPKFVEYVLRNTTGTSGLYLIEYIIQHPQKYSKQQLLDFLSAFKIYREARVFASSKEKEVCSSTEEQLKLLTLNSVNNEFTLKISTIIIPDQKIRPDDLYFETNQNRLMAFANTKENLVLWDLRNDGLEKTFLGPKINYGRLVSAKKKNISSFNDISVFNIDDAVYVFDRKLQKWSTHSISLDNCESMLLDRNYLYIGESSYLIDEKLKNAKGKDYDSLLSSRFKHDNNTAGALSTLNLITGENQILCSNRLKSGENILNNCDPYLIKGIYREDDDHLLLWIMTDNSPGYGPVGKLFRFQLSTRTSTKLMDTSGAVAISHSTSYITFFKTYENSDLFAWDIANKCVVKLLAGEEGTTEKLNGEPIWKIPNPFIIGTIVNSYFNGSHLYLFERISVGTKQIDRVWIFDKNFPDPKILTLKYDETNSLFSPPTYQVNFINEGIAVIKGAGYCFVSFKDIHSLIKRDPEKTTEVIK